MKYYFSCEFKDINWMSESGFWSFIDGIFVIEVFYFDGSVYIYDIEITEDDLTALKLRFQALKIEDHPKKLGYNLNIWQQ